MEPYLCSMDGESIDGEEGDLFEDTPDTPQRIVHGGIQVEGQPNPELEKKTEKLGTKIMLCDVIGQLITTSLFNFTLPSGS